MSSDRYKNEEKGFSYDHAFHAGNVGDVWKHIVLVEAILGLQNRIDALNIIDCHAGRGFYLLGATGEWTEGIGKFIGIAQEKIRGSIERYLQLVQRFGFFEEKKRYPGSPVISCELLRECDAFTGFEIDPHVFTALKMQIGNRENVRVVNDDGLRGLQSFKESLGQNCLILIDPPWTAKSDWSSMPDVLASISSNLPNAAVIVWYPIKSYTRVAAMQKRLRDAHTAFTSLDLITTPLDYKRNRLNGSGLLLLNIDEALVTDIAAYGTIVGRQCAVFSGLWELRIAHAS